MDNGREPATYHISCLFSRVPYFFSIALYVPTHPVSFGSGQAGSRPSPVMHPAFKVEKSPWSLGWNNGRLLVKNYNYV